MSRSKSEKAFCNIPSHKFRSLDYNCNTCYDSICSECIKNHSDHDVTTKKLPDVDTKKTCEKTSFSCKSTFYSTKGSFGLNDKACIAQFPVSGKPLTSAEESQNEQKEHLFEMSNQKDNEELRNKTISELKTKHKTIIQMYFGYQDIAKSDTILVIILSTNDDTIPDHYNGFQIYKRIESDISKEAEDVMYAVGSKGDYSITSDKLKEIKQAIAQNIEKLLSDHSNITIISYCPIKSSRAEKDGKHFKYRDEICIVIHCRIKGIIPSGEKPFPKEINGFSVDVREAYAFFAGMHNNNLPSSHDHQTPVRLGAKIGSFHTMGTLGMFVNLENNETGFITCAHVVLKEEQLNRDLSIENTSIQVYQPGPMHHSNLIGFVKKAKFQSNVRNKTSIDAALVMITDKRRYPTDGFMIKSDGNRLRILGFSADTPPCFDSGYINDSPSPGCRVIKAGAFSGITQGLLCADGIYARMENTKISYGGPQTQFDMYNQYDIFALQDHNLLESGDSGAVVLEGLGQNLKVVGMVIAKTSYGSAIVTPIQPVLEKLDVGMHVKEFRQKSHKMRQLDTQHSSDSDVTDIAENLSRTSINQSKEKVRNNSNNTTGCINRDTTELKDIMGHTHRYEDNKNITASKSNYFSLPPPLHSTKEKRKPHKIEKNIQDPSTENNKYEKGEAGATADYTKDDQPTYKVKTPHGFQIEGSEKALMKFDFTDGTTFKLGKH